jgi:hypothetical protein
MFFKHDPWSLIVGIKVKRFLIGIIALMATGKMAQAAPSPIVTLQPSSATFTFPPYSGVGDS